ncbi:MAG: hypothetical protein LBE85_11950 [Candidatus Accumulibacter sp.]|jgi:hypothetical protein|nr:hypothetical protein [Accumulibacter sp.]
MKLRFGWLGKLARALFWSSLILFLALAVNLVGIRLLGGMDAWKGWMTVNATCFFVWRLLLYAGIAWGWRWMRARLLAREPNASAQARLRRVEVAAALTFIALEGARFL